MSAGLGERMQLFGKVVVFITVLLSFINTMSKSPTAQSYLSDERGMTLDDILSLIVMLGLGTIVVVVVGMVLNKIPSKND